MDYWIIELIAYAIFAILLVVSLVHLAWAFGMAWPAKQRDMLVPTVVGLPKEKPMPPAVLTVVVAFAITCLGVVALWGAGVISVSGFAGVKGWALLGVAAIFSVRGIVTYFPISPFKSAAEPFRSLNRRYFSPLCLLLSAGYTAIFLGL